MIFAFLLAAFTSSLSAAGPSGASGRPFPPRPLFRDGRSSWVISVPRGAARPVKYAAQELMATIGRISGAKLRIVPSPSEQEMNVIRLVCDGNSFEDVFTVKTAPGEIVLRGSSPRAVLFSVYAFLRDRLGARWYWPGESGEYLPRLSRFDVVRHEKTYRSPFASREMSICRIWRHRHPDTERWYAKMFLNGGVNSPEIKGDLGFIRRHGGHTITLPGGAAGEKLFAEHPEWFALLDGKRSVKGIAGCWSNPAFTAYVVSNIVQGIRAADAEIACEFIADVMPRCECAACTADPDRSARFWNYYADLISAIRRDIPGQRFSGIAYQEYRSVPGVPVRDVDHVEYCQYNRCYFHRLDDPACPMNVRSMKEFRAWAKMSPMGVYGYEFDVFTPWMYIPAWNVFADEMRVFEKMGLRRVKTENWVDLNLLDGKNPPPRSRIAQLAYRLSVYAWARLSFDPGLDVDALLEDFCSRVYGKGASAMLAYHRAMADAWGRMPMHLDYFHNNPRRIAAVFITPALEAAATGHLRRAAKAERDDRRAAGEIRLDAECFADWVKYAREARRGVVICDLKEYSEDAFAMTTWLDAKGVSSPWQKTRFKIYRGTDALHIFADCTETENPAFERGCTGKDSPAFRWDQSCIELFVDTGDGALRQIGLSPAGGVWDAKDSDPGWDSGATSRTTFEDGRWTMTIELPYAAFGGKPHSGARWKLMAIRNAGQPSGFKSCGWPVVAHRDMGSAATLVFK